MDFDGASQGFLEAHRKLGMCPSMFKRLVSNRKSENQFFVGLLANCQVLEIRTSPRFDGFERRVVGEELVKRLRRACTNRDYRDSHEPKPSRNLWRCWCLRTVLASKVLSLLERERAPKASTCKCPGLLVRVPHCRHDRVCGSVWHLSQLLCPRPALSALRCWGKSVQTIGYLFCRKRASCFAWYPLDVRTRREQGHWTLCSGLLRMQRPDISIYSGQGVP